MKKQLIIELDANWVLSHREDEHLPIDTLAEELKKLDVVESAAKTLTSLTLLIKEDAQTEKVSEQVQWAFSAAYPLENIDDILTMNVSDAPEAEEGAEVEQIPDANDEDEEEEEDDGSVRAVLKEIDGLVGADELKKLAREIVSVAPEVKSKKLESVLFYQNYLFSIGEGCGLSTYLRLLAKLFTALDLDKMHSCSVIEEKLGPYKDDMEPFSAVMNVLSTADWSNVRILCIDISEWMTRMEHARFKTFLRAVEKAKDKFVVVFRIPFVEKDVMESLKQSLNDLICIKTLSFPPFGRQEIKVLAEREIAEFGYKVSPAAWKYFQERISEEKSDGKFYGLNTIKKVTRELIYTKLLDNAARKKTGNVITANDTKKLSSYLREDGLTGAEMLATLVGNDKIKKQIDEIVAQIELSMRESAAERPCIHMRFVGNPGTGKTTVARIVGKILKERGVLRIGNFFEVKGRDLCGQYIGETAPKTASICRDAYGSVLFIDEAYSLYRGDSNSRDYGREAIDTLVAEMENHRGDFVVIMAGYTDDMEKLMEGNRGLASRMPYTIEFPNFTREELYGIFASMVKKKFRYEEDLLTAAREYFDNFPEEILNSKEFSNGRFVRNLFERTWAKAAMRSQLADKREITLTRDDFERASCEKDFALNGRKKTLIGF